MRGLQTSDVFNFSRLLKKMELKEELKRVLSEIQADNSQRVGLEVIMLFIENICKAEQEFYTFIAPIANKTPEEIKDLPLEETMAICTHIFVDQNFASFFKFAAK